MSTAYQVVHTAIVVVLAVILVACLAISLSDYRTTQRIARAIPGIAETLVELKGEPEPLTALKKEVQELKNAQVAAQNQSVLAFLYGIAMFVLVSVALVALNRSSLVVNDGKVAAEKLTKRTAALQDGRVLTVEFLLARDAAGVIARCGLADVGRFAPDLRDHLYEIERALQEDSGQAGFDAVVHGEIMLESMERIQDALDDVRHRFSDAKIDDLVSRTDKLIGQIRTLTAQKRAHRA